MQIFKYILLIVIAVSSQVFAAAYTFDTASGQQVSVDVDAWAGSGSNESILVIDWNRIDNANDTISESHAFGYRWDGEKTLLDMLNDISAAGYITFDGGSFVGNLSYNDPDGEYHSHIEYGSWNLASTGDAYAHWGSWGNSQWDFNTAGTADELLADGQFEGINAVTYYSSLPDYADDQLDIPMVPEPLSLITMATGSLLYIRRKY